MNIAEEWNRSVEPWNMSSSGSAEDAENEAAIKLVTQVFVPLIFGIIILVGSLGNALVIVVVATNQTMRNTTNVLILNLASADLLFIVFCVPFTASDYALNDWPFGLVWCQSVQYLIYVTSFVSIYTLILMSVDRFLAVVFPVASLGYRTVKNAGLAIFATWLIIAIVSVPIWMSHHLEDKYFWDKSWAPTNSTSSSGVVMEAPAIENSMKYWCRFKGGEYSHQSFHIAFFVSGYAIPLLLIIILYLSMLKRLWHPVGNKISRESLRNKRRVTRLVLIIIVMFAVCWAPIQFLLLFRTIGVFSTDTFANVIIQIASHTLAYLNSCINPILYAFLSDNFRKAFYRFVPSCFRTSHPGAPMLRYELTTLKASTRTSSFRTNSRESSRKPIKRRLRSNSNEEKQIHFCETNDAVGHQPVGQSINSIHVASKEPERESLSKRPSVKFLDTHHKEEEAAHNAQDTDESTMMMQLGHQRLDELKFLDEDEDADEVLDLHLENQPEQEQPFTFATDPPQPCSQNKKCRRVLCTRL